MRKNGRRRSVLSKITFREIRRSLGRYLAVFAIIALGVGLFSGLRVTSTVLVRTVDRFYQDGQLFDYRLLSTLGWTEKQVEAVRARENVRAAEGSWQYDVLLDDGDESVVYRVHSLTDGIDLLRLTKGRFPDAENECILDAANPLGLSLGDTVRFSRENESDTLDAFKTSTFTVSGFADSALYTNYERGTSSIGNGTVRGFIYLPKAAFDTDYYTEIYVRLNQDQEIFSDTYADAMDGIRTDWEESTRAFAEDRYDDLVNDAQKELDDAKAEFEGKKTDGEKELSDAERELRDAKKKLDDAEKELTDGKQELDDAQADLTDGKKELADAEAQLADGWASLAENGKALDDARAELESAGAELSDGWKQFEEGKKQLEESAAQLEEGKTQLAQAEQQLSETQAVLEGTKEQLDAAKAELDALKQQLGALPDGCAEYEAGLAGWNAGNAQYEEGLEQYEAGLAEYEAGKAQYEASKAEYEAGLAAYEEGKAELDASEKTLLEAQASYDSGWWQYKDGMRQYREGYREYLDGVAEYEQGKREYEDGLADYEQGKKDYEDGLKEYEDGKKEYQDGLKEYEDGKLEFDEKIAEAQKKIDDAQREIDDIEEPDTYVLERNTNIAYASFESDSQIVKQIAGVFPVFFFLVAALVCVTTMTRMVEEQRGQIGTLKGLGYAPREIIKGFLFYSGSAAFLGCMAGYAAGIFLFPAVIWRAYETIYIPMPIRFVFDPWLLVLSLASSLLCSLGTAYLSCRSALKESAASLMRPKSPKPGKRIFLERIPAVWKRIGFMQKVTLRNIFRYKKRLVMMVLGISGCMALLVTGFGIRDSISGFADEQFDTIQTADAEVSFKGGKESVIPADLEKRLGSLNADYTGFVHSSMDAVFPERIKSVVVMAPFDMEAFESFFHLKTADGRNLTIDSHSDGAFISISLAERYGVKTGDIVALRDEDMHMFGVRIDGIFENHVYDYLIFSPELLARNGEKADVNRIYVQFSENEDVYKCQTILSKSKDVSNVSILKDVRTRLDKTLDSLVIIIVLIIICAGALSFIVLYNLTNINIIERMREIATIKVLGYFRRETSDYILRENVLMTAMGAAAGIGMGVALHRFIMSKISVDLIYFPVTIKPVSYLYAVILTFVFTFLVNLVMSARLEKINMAESLKSVE